MNAQSEATVLCVPLEPMYKTRGVGSSGDAVILIEHKTR